MDSVLRQSVVLWSEKSTVLKFGTFEYFKPRMDGETHFTITENIIKHHVEMEKCQFDGITSFDRANVWGLFGNEDTQVNCRVFINHIN